jgi:hypothetical protein
MKRTFTAGLAALMLIGLAPAHAEPRFAPIPKAVIADPARDPARPTWPPSPSPPAASGSTP